MTTRADADYRRRLIATREADANHEAMMTWICGQLKCTRDQLKRRLAGPANGRGVNWVERYREHMEAPQ